jgi:hypothetical protein
MMSTPTVAQSPELARAGLLATAERVEALAWLVDELVTDAIDADARPILLCTLTDTLAGYAKDLLAAVRATTEAQS